MPFLSLSILISRFFSERVSTPSEACFKRRLFARSSSVLHLCVCFAVCSRNGAVGEWVPGCSVFSAFFLVGRDVTDKKDAVRTGVGEAGAGLAPVRPGFAGSAGEHSSRGVREILRDPQAIQVRKEGIPLLLPNSSRATTAYNVPLQYTAVFWLCSVPYGCVAAVRPST